MLSYTGEATPTSERPPRYEIVERVKQQHEVPISGSAVSAAHGFIRWSARVKRLCAVP
jgi:hypothetical protein